MNQAIKIIQDKMEKISEQEKIFRELWDNDYADNNAMVNIMLEWIINEISSLPSDTQWIDVKERLPETKWRYTVFVEWTVATLWYTNDYWYNALLGKQSNVTHWMPLPPNPSSHDSLHSS